MSQSLKCHQKLYKLHRKEKFQNYGVMKIKTNLQVPTQNDDRIK
jgi:hypothetical protein